LRLSGYGWRELLTTRFWPRLEVRRTDPG